MHLGPSEGERIHFYTNGIRNRVGDAAVVTHTQQSNVARYGDGTDHTRYQVLQTVEEQTGGVALLPENRIGIASVWAGLSDELVEYWNDRIDELAR